MKKAFLILCLGFLLLGTGLAQDQKTQLTNLLQNSRDPLEAAILTDLVTLNLSPEWWDIMLDPTDSNARTNLRILLSGVLNLAKNMGLGDAREHDDLSMIKAWKGRITLTINMEFAPNETTKKYAMDTLDDIAYPLGSKAKPRSKSMNFTATLSPPAKKLSGTVSPDGGTYKITFPVSMEWRQLNLIKYLEAGR